MDDYMQFEDAAYFDDFDDLNGFGDAEIGFADDFDDADMMDLDFDGEADEWGFLKKAWKGIKSVAKKVAPIAKSLAPIAGKVIGGAFGGPAGAMIGGQLGGLISNLEDEPYEAGYDGFDYEGDYEDEMDTADEMDAEDFMGVDSEDEDVAEYMADLASKAPSSTDSQAIAGAVTITIASRAPIQVKQVAPTLASGAARLTKLLKRNPQSRILVKTVPTIAKKTVATLTKKAAKGKKITPRTAKRVMAKHAVRTLSNSREMTKALAKNEVKKRRVNKKAVMRAERYV
jgi:hypothetical protein